MSEKKSIAVVVPAAGRGVYSIPVEVLETIQCLTSTVASLPYEGASLTVEIPQDAFDNGRPEFAASPAGNNFSLTQRDAQDASDAFEWEPLYAIRLRITKDAVTFSVPETDDYPSVVYGTDRIWRDCAAFSPLAKLLTERAVLEDAMVDQFMEDEDVTLGGGHTGAAYEIVGVTEDAVEMWVAARHFVSLTHEDLAAHRKLNVRSKHDSQDIQPGV